MTHGLMLGDLILTGSWATADPEHDFWFQVAADGTEFGSPEAVSTIIELLLTDGDLVEWDRDGNRVIRVRILVKGPSLGSVAHGEAALRRATKRENTLTWQPPDEFAAPSAYDTFPSPMEREGGRWDLAEKQRFERMFNVPLAAMPYARTVDLTTSAALEAPGAASTITVDTCDSAAGWTGTRSGASWPAAVWEAGSVGVAELDALVTSPEVWTLTRTGSIDFTSTPYLVAEIRTLAADVGDPMDVRARVPMGGSFGGYVDLPVLAVEKVADGSSYFRVIFAAGGRGTVSSVTFTHTSTKGHPWQGLYVRHVGRTNQPPARSSRQSSRIIPVGGTERTPGTLHVQTATGTGALGITMAHISPADGSGYAPDLMRHWVSGNASPSPVADATSPSGVSDFINPAAVKFRVPSSAIPTDGYTICAWLKSDTLGPTPIWWSAATIPPGMSPQGSVGDRVVHDFTITGWEFVTLGTEILPTVQTPNGTVEFSIQLEAGGSAFVKIGEWWCFRAGEESALIVVADNPHPHLWVTSSQVGGAPRIEVGTETSRTHPGDKMLSMGSPTFGPDGVAVHLITGAQNAKVDASFYRRYLHNVAEES